MQDKFLLSAAVQELFLHYSFILHFTNILHSPYIFADVAH